MITFAKREDSKTLIENYYDSESEDEDIING